MEPSSRFEPLGGANYRLHLSVAKPFMDKLARVKDALSHVEPSGDTVKVLERALDRILADAEKRQTPRRSRSTPPKHDRRSKDAASARTPAEAGAGEASGAQPEQTQKAGASELPAEGPSLDLPSSDSGLGRPVGSDAISITSPPSDSAAAASRIRPVDADPPMAEPAPPANACEQDGGRKKRRRLSAEDERVVRARDGNRCVWKMPDGSACGSTWQIEIDEIVAQAKGGEPSIENCRCLCRAHNQQHAWEDFGEEWMGRFKRTRDGTAPGRSRR